MIPATVEQMKAAGKTYDPVTYDGAQHGFMRLGDAPDGTMPTRQRAPMHGHVGEAFSIGQVGRRWVASEHSIEPEKIRRLRRSELPVNTLAMARYLIGKTLVLELRGGRIQRAVSSRGLSPR